MKKKSLFLTSAAFLLSLGCLTGCNLNANTITVWVGKESVAYYTQAAEKFVSENPDFTMKIKINEADTGSAAGEMLKDNTSCADILTVAHDNIGKLSQLSYIAPIVDKDLLKQIDEDNPDSFKDVIKNILGDGEADPTKYTFGVPYISQALFLYYDTRYVTDEEAETFEGLVQAAKRYDTKYGVSGTKGWTVTGDDGFNFSYSLLSRHLNDDGTHYSSLHLFDDHDTKKCYVQSNDQVAVMRWLQRMYANDNGFLFNNGSTWALNMQNHKCLSIIGGAWHYDAFKTTVTDGDKIYMGCKRIPTFELMPEDVQGIDAITYPNSTGVPEELRGTVDPAPQAGTKFRGGSFVDCKCFVINMAAMGTDERVEKYYNMCKLIKYFSSKEVQKGSFKEALNVPAYEGSEEYIESIKNEIDPTAYLMATAQTGMASYGISQPFVDASLNTRYYSKGTPDLYKNCMIKREGVGVTVEGIRELLWQMEYIWKWGANADTKKSAYPKSFPAASDTKCHGSAE